MVMITREKLNRFGLQSPLHSSLLESEDSEFDSLHHHDSRNCDPQAL